MSGGAAMLLAVGFCWAMHRRWCERAGGDPTLGWPVAVAATVALAALGMGLGALADRIGGG